MANLKIWLTGLVIIIAAYSCKQKDSLEKYDNLTILHLSGSSYEQGLAHGQYLTAEIRDIIQRWEKEVEAATHRNLDEVIDDFFSSTTYLDTIKRYCPYLLDEVKGISEASGIEYNTLLAFQMSEEMDAMSDDLKGGYCISIGISKKGTAPSILAQNMDPPKYLHGSPTLLHITNNKTHLESYVYTFPGFMGLNGLNSRGVAITCNGMSMLNYSKDGLPVSFIVRTILDQDTEKEAFELLDRIPISVPQCFTIGGINQVCCFECSANQKKEFYPFADKTISLHTNFAAANRDFNERFIDLLKEYGKNIDDPYFCPRYFLAYDEIVAVSYKLDTDNIKRILSLTSPDIEPISNDQTYGCLIMELTKDPVLNIAPGRPDTTAFIRLSFNELPRGRIP